ncbi:MAG: hypothetical protein ABI261_08245 [Ginsengibacter sp.]
MSSRKINYFTLPHHFSTVKPQIMKNCILLSLLFISTQLLAQTSQQQMHLNDKEYLEYQGVNVMLAWDFYSEGHQRGVGAIFIRA